MKHGAGTYDDQDELRLLGLSRIPRCAACRLFQALRTAHETRSPLSLPPPPVPRDCSYQFCMPLVARYAEAGVVGDDHATKTGIRSD